MSEEQNDQLEKQKFDYELQIKNLQDENQIANKSADEWEQKFHSFAIEKELERCVQGAFNPQLVVTYLKPFAKFISILDERGNKQGEKIVVECFDDLTGKTVQRTPQQAVEKLKGSQPNLFGIGVQIDKSALVQSQADAAKLNMAEYMKVRKEKPWAVGL